MKRQIPKYDDNGKALWLCLDCKQWLPEESFSKEHEKCNGLQSRCRKCYAVFCREVSQRPHNHDKAKINHREYMRRIRITNPELLRARERKSDSKRIDNPLKYRARLELNWAVLTKRIIRPTTCSQCGKVDRITAHHPDYSKPLEVVWLCYECHGNK